MNNRYDRSISFFAGMRSTPSVVGAQRKRGCFYRPSSQSFWSSSADWLPPRPRKTSLQPRWSVGSIPLATARSDPGSLAIFCIRSKSLCGTDWPTRRRCAVSSRTLMRVAQYARWSSDSLRSHSMWVLREVSAMVYKISGRYRVAMVVAANLRLAETR